MTLKENLVQDMNTARKEKNETVLATLAFVLGEIQREEKRNKPAREFTDAEVLKQVSSTVKKIKESIKEFEKSSNPAEDRISKARAEVEVLSAYLPKELSEDEVSTIINDVVSGMENLDPKKGMGMVMKGVNAKVQGRFDGKRISEMVRERLASL